MYGSCFIGFTNAVNSTFQWQLWQTVIYFDKFGTVKLDWKILKEAKEWTNLLEVWLFECPDLTLELENAEH